MKQNHYRINAAHMRYLIQQSKSCKNPTYKASSLQSLHKPFFFFFLQIHRFFLFCFFFHLSCDAYILHPGDFKQVFSSASLISPQIKDHKIVSQSCMLHYGCMVGHLVTLRYLRLLQAIFAFFTQTQPLGSLVSLLSCLLTVLQ